LSGISRLRDITEFNNFRGIVQKPLLEIIIRPLFHSKFNIGRSLLFGDDFVEVEEDVREGGVGGEEDWIEVIGDG
jgi:hypothetical protein